MPSLRTLLLCTLCALPLAWGHTSPLLLDEKALLSDPTLFAPLINQAINQQNWPLLQALLKAYAKVDAPDPYWYRRAWASLAQAQGQYQAAITQHEWLHQHFPEDTRVALDLGRLYLQNRQYGQARHTFTQAQRTPHLPIPVLQNIQLALQHIQKQTQWQWSGGLSPVYQRNINQVAPQYCQESPFGRLCSQAPMAGWGLQGHLGVEKYWFGQGQQRWGLSGQAQGKRYFMAKHRPYEQWQTHWQAHWIWETPQRQWKIAPLLALQWRGNAFFEDKRSAPSLRLYQRRLGGQLSYRHLLKQGSQLHIANTIWRQYHQSPDVALSQNGLWWQSAFTLQPKSWPIWLRYSLSALHPDHPQVNGAPNTQGYWQQQWTLGTHTQWRGWQAQGQFSMAWRRYAHNTQQQRREDYDLQVELGLSHNRIQWRGWQPMLWLEGQRLWSNRRHAERRDWGVRLEVQRRY